MSSLAAISAVPRLSAELFAAPTAPTVNDKHRLAAIDDCGTVPRKFPVPPPPPPSPFGSLVPSRFIDEWCGTVPRKFPFPPPPPPWVDGVNQMLGSR